jgi:hypothetical protein
MKRARCDQLASVRGQFGQHRHAKTEARRFPLRGVKPAQSI